MIQELRFQFLDSLDNIPASEWNALSTAGCPFLRHEFLNALEQTGCVSGQTGWLPHHLLVFSKEQLVAALPLYVKHHSYGEYVFDFAWAEAYQRYGFQYYPKLLSAIPFTPVPGPRLLLAEGISADDLWPALSQTLAQHCQEHGFSSAHILFPNAEQSRQLQEQNFIKRHSVQFHWLNRGYGDFDAFLNCFASRKRKNLKKERAKLTDYGICCRRLTGTQIDETAMDFFVKCYQQTYLKRSGHRGYLSPAFFDQLRKVLVHQMMLVLAYKAEKPIAASLFFYDDHSLCGRYWGCVQEVDGLHFEACYYQGIEFCIERGLTLFNPGTQGEHKILRGFEPTLCYSNHYIADPAFRHAIATYLQQEAEQVLEYQKDASRLLPFRADLG
ncbi:GNAT family N-acetyltransferase [Aliiglaciecola sp. CAU 1673]|uniref:GNAT family N-acetyltransferase n=1 Tax=Aliiglaciecola sp. CAU 1673 TaxID=3032595 RepID=UPI0023DC43B8|nr:GNAT family N-acetyltransferase [Aliiglaciecola sp. CAU 1673]MDF2178257.1 GNAT family N-acetyltransferase [Aliiglaciecola sp. CAU 1673]